MWGCGGTGDGDPPPTPPGPTITTTVPLPPPEEPPPPPEAEPSDYITIERANCPATPATEGLCEDLRVELQELTWGGWRDIEYVATYCAWALLPGTDAYIQRTRGEMLEFADAGLELLGRGQGFVARLGLVNHRCPLTHQSHEHGWVDDDRFCGRTEVQRARLSEFRFEVREHMAEAYEIRADLEGEPGEGVRWDSMAEWCRLANGGSP